MKKAILVLTMLVSTMGVSFTSNAQVEIHTMDVNNVTPDWIDVGTDANWRGNGNQTDWGFVEFLDGDVELEREFDFSTMDSIEIFYDFTFTSPSSPSTYNIYFNILVDNEPINVETSVNGNRNGSIVITNEDIAIDLNENSVIEINFIFTGSGISGDNDPWYLTLNSFSISGYNTAGIDRNDLSDKLEVYSFNKSIFFKSDESMKADVTVYNLSGQVVSSENINLSYSKSEVNLYDLPTGVYIVNVIDDSAIMQKKVFIE